MLFEFLCETLEALGDVVDRADVFLEDDLLGWGGADDLRKPPSMSRSPVGAAAIADIVTQQKSLEPELGGFEAFDRLLTGSGEVANGFIFELGDIDGCEITGTHQGRELDGVTAVGFDAVAGLFRD